MLAMLQAASATARKSVQDAQAAAHRKIDEEYGAIVASLELKIGDVAQAVLPPLEQSPVLAAKFFNKLCVLPGKTIDSDVMQFLMPDMIKHAEDDNDMVVEMCTDTWLKTRPPCIESLKGDFRDPRCKEWYHIVHLRNDGSQPLDGRARLAEAVAWAEGEGKTYGAKVRITITKLPAWKVQDAYQSRLKQLRALVLVDAVTQEPLATVPHQPKRLRRLVDEE